MKILGFEITRVKAINGALPSQPNSWLWGRWPIIREPSTGAWQKNMEIKAENVLTYFAVWACVTLIASDIGKIRLRLVQQDDDGIWSEVESPSFSPVLRKPNHYQNRIKFIEQWILSKLIFGNTYILKGRDNRGVVTALYVLDPLCTKPLVAPDGSVYYELKKDDLAGVREGVIRVPASEIIHDVMIALYHPLCGVSPISACGLAAVQGMSIQNNSTQFFQSGSKPGGIITAPTEISDTQAREIKDYWDNNFTGENAGKVAVLSGGLQFHAQSVTAEDAQLIKQLEWTAQNVCSTFHVPPYMIGIGPMPNYNNIEALNQQYYTQCLQSLIESIELSLDEGLALNNVPDKTYGTEFDLDDLLRMDTATKVKSWSELVGAGIAKPNEARARFEMKPTEGGDTPYLQQQNYSLAALNKRDTSDDPFASKTPTVVDEPAPDDDDEAPPDEDGENDDASAAERYVNQIINRSKQFYDAT